MKRITSIAVCLLLAVSFAAAQTSPQVPNYGFNNNSKFPEACFIAGTGALVTGVACGILNGLSETPNRTLGITSTGLCVAGGAAAAVGAVSMICNHVPGGAIMNFAPYLDESRTLEYVKWAKAGGATIAAGVGLFTVGFGTYLIEYHYGTDFSNGIHADSIMCGLGFLCVVTGGVIFAVNDYRYQKAGRMAKGNTLAFGGTPNGLGLTYTF